MKIYNEPIALQSQKQREVLNLTTRVKAAVEKSGLREGIALVSSPYSNTAIVVGDDDIEPLNGFGDWLGEIGPARDDLAARPERAATARFRDLLLRREVVIAFSEGRLDLGSRQAILFVELDGLRPRRIVLKILGE